MTAIVVGAKTAFLRRLVAQTVPLDDTCITTAQSGSEVLSTVTEQPLDLVIIADSLTPPNGTELVTTLRKTDPTIKIVLVRTDRSGVRNRSADATMEVVEMPFQANGLRSACRAALGS